MTDAGTLTVAGLQVAAALGITAFWVTWLRAEHAEPWLPPGYVQHERAFVWADGLLAILLVVSSVLLLAGAPAGHAVGLVCAGMLTFLGVLDAAYFAREGMFAPERGGWGNALVVTAVLGLAFVLFAVHA